MLAMISVALLRLAVEMRKVVPVLLPAHNHENLRLHSPEHTIPRRAAYGPSRLLQLQALSAASTESYVTCMVARHPTGQ